MGQGQKFSLEPIEVNEEVLMHEKAEVSFTREFKGKISNSIDSSIYHKFTSKKSFKHKQSIDIRKVGALSQVGYYELKMLSFQT